MGVSLILQQEVKMDTHPHGRLQLQESLTIAVNFVCMDEQKNRLLISISLAYEYEIDKHNSAPVKCALFIESCKKDQERSR